MACGVIVLLTAVALVGITRLDYEMQPGTDVRSDDDNQDYKLLVKLYKEFNHDTLREAACTGWQSVCLDEKLVQNICRCSYIERKNYL